ncbi:hypothetical protein HYX06_02105 [Candidatus Woesearchaeota archaeon]|nr:hypothetical protein [Candidatus Woesearchaeota archaeon]
MNITTDKIDQKFAMSQRKGIAEIIKAKGILNIAKSEPDSQLPLSHETILLSTISGSFDMPVPKIQLASMQGNNSASKDEQEDAEGKNTASKKWGYKSSLNI